MTKTRSIPLTKIVAALVFLVVTLSLGAAERHTLMLNGHSTEVPVIYVNGHPYVGLEALAKVLNGSVSAARSSAGGVVGLSLPSTTENSAPSPKTTSPVSAPPSASTQGPPSNPGFSREFLNAGIEQISALREWHTTLQTAIQVGIPLSQALLEPYRAEATKNLRLASVAATTTADRNAYQLLNHVSLNMGQLSDKYVNMRAKMIYIAPDALQNDELNKRIVNCSHFLATMAASGQFSDDRSCH
jgi:hypothetical protein